MLVILEKDPTQSQAALSQGGVTSIAFSIPLACSVFLHGTYDYLIEHRFELFSFCCLVFLGRMKAPWGQALLLFGLLLHPQSPEQGLTRVGFQHIFVEWIHAFNSHILQNECYIHFPGEKRKRTSIRLNNVIYPDSHIEKGPIWDWKDRRAWLESQSLFPTTSHRIEN